MKSNYSNVAMKPEMRWRLKRMAVLENTSMLKLIEKLIWDAEKQIIFKSRKNGDDITFRLITQDINELPKSMRCED